MIRLVLAEDQTLLRSTLASLLGLEDDITVVAEAADGDTAWDQIRAHDPDILVTDIEMPGQGGIDLAERIRAEGLGTHVLIVTTFDRPGYLQRAMAAGVAGYLLKDTSSEELAKAVRTVAAGGRVVAPELAMASWTSQDPLTAREREVLRLAETGMVNKRIAASLNLSSGTVRNYLANAASKLGASNRIEACRIARERGLL